MKRKFITNLALLLFLNLMVKPFWMFGIDRKVQNMVGAEEYGLYFSLFSLSILLNILLDFGIINFNNREIAQNTELLNSRLSQIIPLKFSLAVIYGLIVIISGLILGYSPRQFNILWILIINQFLLSFILYLRSNISGLHLFRTDSIISVMDRVLMIIICSILIWTDLFVAPFKIEWFIYAQTVSYLITSIVVFFIVLNKSGRIHLDFRWKYGLAILKQSYPFALLVLLMSFFNRIDSVMLERMLINGKTEAGIYAQSFRILDATTMFALLFAGLLLPIFSRMLKQGEKTGEMVKLSFSLLIIPALTLVVISIFYNKNIISLLYLEHLDYSSTIYRILIISLIFSSTSYIFGTLLTANGSLLHLNILAGITLVLNVSLNLILIPRYEAKGAAIANLCSQGFYAIAQVITAQRLLKLKINMPLLIRFLSFIIILFIVTWFINRYIQSWGAGFFIICILAVMLMWLLGINSPKSIYSIIKNNN